MTETRDTQDLPRLVLQPLEGEVVRVLRALQTAILRHPVAAQAAFSALIAEGRRFAETPDGREWRGRLTRSSLLHRARLAWETTSLWMLEEDPPSVLPSTFLDALFMAASSNDLEPLLDRLFRETVTDDAGS